MIDDVPDSPIRHPPVNAARPGRQGEEEAGEVDAERSSEAEGTEEAGVGEEDGADV